MLEKPREKLARSELVSAALDGLQSAGYEVARAKGRSRIWTLSRDGKTQTACMRTSQDRDFAFPPEAGGWKTLDDVDKVIVAAVDDKHQPRNIQVYLFPADDVRGRFNSNYKARSEAHQDVRDGFGMWVRLDRDDRGVPASVGSGITEQYPPIAVVPLVDGSTPDLGQIATLQKSREAETISDVMDAAVRRIAEIAGVPVENVKLDLNIKR